MQTKLQHVIQVKNGIMNRINLSVKIMICANKTIVGILAHK